MTILVLGHIRFAAGDGERARETLAAHARACEAEQGCELYSFAFDAAEPDLARIAERWESAEALAAHGKADHQRAFGRALRDYKVEAISAKAWDGQFWRTLVGD